MALESFPIHPLFMNYTQWEDGETGTVGKFIKWANGNTQVYGTDPWGNTTVLWKASTQDPPDVTYPSQGGIYYQAQTIDPTKRYRFAFWENRYTNNSATYGRYYFGCNGYGTTNGVYHIDNDTLNTNPYFWSRNHSDLTEDQWFLIVGHIYEHDYAGTTNNQNGSGRYTVADGRIGDISDDFKWHSSSSTGRPRTLAIYRGDVSGMIHYTAYTRWDVCDGSEPSVESLVAGIDSINYDYLFDIDGVPSAGVDKYGIWHSASISEVGPVGGLLNYWKLNGEFRDWAGDNQGTFTGTETYVSGCLGEALSNNGTANYFTLDDTITMDAEFSVSFVANRTDTTAYHFVIGTTTGAGLKPKIGFTTGTQYLFVRILDAGSSDSATAPVTTATDTHVVVTRDSEDKVDAYVNGTKYDLFSDAAQVGDFTIDRIGTDEGSQEMNGWYDEIRVYNRELTSAEVNQLYNVYINEYPMQFDSVGGTLLRGQLITI